MTPAPRSRVPVAAPAGTPGAAALAPYASLAHRRWLADEAGEGGRHRRIEGSLLFADVSGFTPLAERLARKGKVGAEELTDTLNAVFTDLLGVASAHGGDCLKFGGDALLLLFDGPGHARRAAAAAMGMQGALQALRRQRSSVGVARLGISMGVHTAPIDAVLAGSSHRELIVAGPAVTGVLALETAAGAGEVLVGDATAAALELDEVEEVEAGLRLRRAPTAALHPTAPAGTGEGAVPVAIRAHLEHLPPGRHDGEHRLAAVGFVQIGGTDQLLLESGPAALAGALHVAVDAAQRACAEHGATFVATDVDKGAVKVVLAAGVPSAGDDDEDRLLLAARAVVERVPPPLSARAGLHRGRIFAVDLGSPARRTFTVMGDAVNLAARVMGRADPGQVLATEELVERARGRYELAPLPPFEVKGKSQAVRASAVGAAIADLADQAVALGPLVGRAAELQQLRDACAGAREGRGRIVELVGEPGIGKSRLLAAAVEEAGGDLLHFRFEAGRYSLATPYFALRRGLREAMGLGLDTPAAEVEAALRAVVADTAPELEPWLPLLGTPLGIEIPDTPQSAKLDADRRRAILQEAVVSLMGKVLDRPTLITVEDSHWLDVASSDLLLALLGQVDARPWAVVVTRRPVEGGLDLSATDGVVRLAVAPLDRAALLELAGVLAGELAAAGPLPPGSLERLVDRCGGNPLFLHELVASRHQGELPETIEAVVAATIDTLAPADRALLRHAAVLGGHVPLAALAAMVDLEPGALAARLRPLRHFLLPGRSATVQFRHILLRDVAYEALSFRARRELHARAGRILEGSSDAPDELAELLSIHFHRAGDHRSAWRYARVAAERARHNGASVEAAGFYDVALDAAAHLPDVALGERREIAEQLGDACELSGRYDRAAAAYLRARRAAADDAAARVRLCRKLGYVRDHEGRYGAAERWFARGRAELAAVADRRDSARLRAELATALVSSRIRQGRHARSRPLIESAIGAAEESGDRAALAHAYFVLDQLLVDQGRYSEARHSERAARIYEELGDDRGAAAAYNEVGNTAYWLGRWDEAVASYEAAIEADRRAGALVYLAIYLNNIGEIRSDQGRWDEARGLLEEAHALWTAGGWRAGSGWALSNLGRLAARAGRDEEAAEHLARARELLAAIGADAMLIETEAREMERLVLAGDHGAALGMADPLHERARRLGIPNVADLVQRTAGCAWAQAGQPEAGWELLDACLASSRKAEAEYEVALTIQAMARVGRLLGRRDVDVMEIEVAAIFDRLGVVATPAIPGLGSPA